MEVFHHEIEMLREVADGLRERLMGHPDWAVYERTGMPTVHLNEDPRFLAWRTTTDALDHLVADGKQLRSPDVVSNGSDPASADADPTPQVMVPIAAAPRRAIGAQVSTVEVVHKVQPSKAKSTEAGQPSGNGPVQVASDAPNLAPKDARRVDDRLETGHGSEKHSSQNTKQGFQFGTAVPDPDIADPLTRIRGVTPAFAKTLNQIGVFRFAQIASWQAGDVERATQALGLTREIHRQNWIEQAALLALRQSMRPAVRQISETASATRGAAHTTRAQTTPDQSTPATEADTANEATAGASVVGMGLPVRDRGVVPPPLPKTPAHFFEVNRASVGVIQKNAPDQALAQSDGVEPTPSNVATAPFGGEQARATSAPVVVSAEPPEPILDLANIAGMAPDHEKTLARVGIQTTADLAAVDGASFQTMSATLAPHAAPARKGWIEQAALLASGVMTAHAELRRMGAVNALVPRPIEQPWHPRLIAAKPEAVEHQHDEAFRGAEAEDAGVRETSNLSALDARIAQLQRQVEEIRTLPGFASGDRAHADETQDGAGADVSLLPWIEEPPPLPDEMAPQAQIAIERPNAPAVTTERFVIGRLPQADNTADLAELPTLPDHALPDDGWDDLAAADAEGQAAVKIIKKDPPPNSEVTLEQRLTERLKSVREPRSTATKRPPKPNYMLNPEEASVQIVVAPSDSQSVDRLELEFAPDPEDGGLGATAADDARSRKAKKAGPNKYLRALTGDR